MIHQNHAIEQEKHTVLTAHHLFLLVLCISTAALIAWSWYGRLDVVSLAGGKVIPGSMVKTVQHLEGGIVKKILVQEGQRVKDGQTLMELSRTGSSADLARLEMLAAARQADIVRLSAMLKDARKLHFTGSLENQYPDIAKQNRALFQTGKKALKSQLAVLHQQLEQRKKKAKVLRVRITGNQKNLELTTKQRNLSRKLLQENLTTSYKQLDLERQVASLEGKIQTDRVSLEEARLAFAEVQARILQARVEYHAKAEELLQKTRENLQTIAIQRRKYTDNLARTEIKSPVDGIVKTLHIVTLGGVIRPGMAVAEIVPEGDYLLIEAHLPVEDIGYVHVGQQAAIRLASSDARHFGKITGQVVFVGPDASMTRDQRPFYTLRVRPNKERFDNGYQQYQLSPGLQVMVSLHIGSRSVLQYLFDPFLNSLAFSLQER